MDKDTALILFQGINLIILVYLGRTVSIKIEKIKSGLSRDLQIHRVQFGREFQVYRCLWMKIAHLRRALQSYSRTDEKAIRWEKFKSIAAEFNGVRETILNNTPFIKKEIYDLCESLLDDVFLQTLHLEKTKESEDFKYSVEERKKNILDIIEKIENAIRRYIQLE